MLILLWVRLSRRPMQTQEVEQRLRVNGQGDKCAREPDGRVSFIVWSKARNLQMYFEAKCKGIFLSPFKGLRCPFIKKSFFKKKPLPLFFLRTHSSSKFFYALRKKLTGPSYTCQKKIVSLTAVLVSSRSNLLPRFPM